MRILCAILLLLCLASPARAIMPLELRQRIIIHHPMPNGVDWIEMQEEASYGDDGEPHYRPVKIHNPHWLTFYPKEEGRYCLARIKWNPRLGRWEITRTKPY